MAKLLATDLDGTLFYPKRRIRLISKRTKKFAQKFIDDGNYFVAVSGRNIGPCNRIFERLDRKGIAIGCNGSFVSENGKIIYDKTFDGQVLRKVIKFCEENYPIKGFYIMSKDDEFVQRNKFKSLFYRFVNALWYFFQGALRNPYEVNEEKFYKIIDEGRGHKLMVMFGVSKKSKQRALEANKELFKTFGQEIEASWSNEFIEISPYGCNKSNGLKFLENYLKINHDDIFVIGDSGNDISMFKEYQNNSFCMKHAPLSVSKYAKHTLKKFENIEAYLNEDKERK